MKKKYVLRKGTKNLIKAVMVVCALVVMSECENTTTFIITHLVALGIIILGAIVLSE